MYTFVNKGKGNCVFELENDRSKLLRVKIDKQENKISLKKEEDFYNLIIKSLFNHSHLPNMQYININNELKSTLMNISKINLLNNSLFIQNFLFNTDLVVELKVSVGLIIYVRTYSYILTYSQNGLTHLIH